MERRVLGYVLPWAATRHHPNWDVIRSHQLIHLGAKLVFAENDLAIADLIPEDRPWYQTADQLARHEAWHRALAEGKAV